MIVVRLRAPLPQAPRDPEPGEDQVYGLLWGVPLKWFYRGYMGVIWGL